MQAWVSQYGIGDVNRLIDYAFALADGYGSATASLACQMYDNIAEASNVILPAAEPAELATVSEVAMAVNATKDNTRKLANAVSRFSRLAAADTMLKNAKRDKAQFAWIPSGDSCAFCFALASNGWRNASEEVMKGNHAAHVHANCDCTFAIRFSDKLDVEGYDPDSMREEYEAAEGNTPLEKINSLRRKFRDANKDRINAQKRQTYWDKKSLKYKHSNSGAMTGEYTDENDPLYEIRNEIADRFYEETRNRKPQYEIAKVARNSGMSEEEIERVYNHIFIRKHLLDDGEVRLFDSNYEMAQSWKRLSEGKNIQKHDIILLKHELMEEGIMGDSLEIPYRMAHNKADEVYNYRKALEEYLKEKDNVDI